MKSVNDKNLTFKELKTIYNESILENIRLENKIMLYEEICKDLRQDKEYLNKRTCMWAGVCNDTLKPGSKQSKGVNPKNPLRIIK